MVRSTGRRDTLVTLANRITMTRLLLVPVVATLVALYSRDREALRYAALVVFVIAALSDGIDGIIARRFNQRSELGAVLDPLADKLLINITLIFLAATPELRYPLPKWFPVVVLTRDLVIVLGSYLISERFGVVRVHPRFWGKLNTILQVALVVTILMQLEVSYVILYLTLVSTVLSLRDYVRDGLRQAREWSADNA